jgi:hypothetical protein
MLGVAADPASTRIDCEGLLTWDLGKVTHTLDRTGYGTWRIKDTGQLHRIGAAAEIRSDGSTSHWRNGVFQLSVAPDSALKMPAAQIGA